MKTVVYQSYRISNVPPFIDRCMETVRDWTASQRFDYHFLDDRMFDYAPDWYRKRVGNNVCLVSDYARLAIAKELLAGAYERAIWVDADLLVIDPIRFSVPVEREYAFCREVWVGLGPQGEIGFRHGVNNAVSAFVRGNRMIDFYLHACETIVRSKVAIDRLDVGTNFLSKLNSFMPLPLLNGVGLLSPLVIDGIVRQIEAPLKLFAAAFQSPIFAANLCSSFRGRVHDGVHVDDGLFDRVIDELLSSRGEAINGFEWSRKGVSEPEA